MRQKFQRSENKELNVRLRLVPGKECLSAVLRTTRVKTITIEGIAKEVIAYNRSNSETRRVYTQLMFAMEDPHKYAVVTIDKGKRKYLTLDSDTYLENYINQAQKESNSIEIAILALNLEEEAEQE